ncbi:hypothetical protein [Methylobacterium platani]|uniref:Uncharacterized protein n=2 Tax=Methylobacterium platani TaxID=427683 RepID=A0A179S812_9HYPH|nr:hypothetical protein [Methylobacterium platani]KMO22405.1 hypothetical protein SQ03_00545 [Methylobacterium platani JCM 14648]OAS22488.1 hypothetical protein A5481_19015 [Methylobacterium platani]
MTEPANTNRSSEKRKPDVSADDVQALRAVYAAQTAAARRINDAVKAGSICPIMGPAHRSRASQALELAIRGVIPPAQATLEIAKAEFEAMGRTPLPLVDWGGIQAVVSWDDAVREPPRPPEPPQWLHYKDRDHDFQRAEHERLMDEPNYVEFDEPEGADAA